MGSTYDIIVIGAGHAGSEAAHAAARMGCRVLLFNLTVETVALMSCNPAIGGTAKGHLVKEIDAMGGLMGLAADRACLHFKTLNLSKGPAVWSSRAQTDRDLYRRAVLGELESHPLISLRQGMVREIVVEGGRFAGVRDEAGLEYPARAGVVATGTFLDGLIHIGGLRVPAGRAGEFPSVSLAACLRALGFSMGRLKTGTPPRLRRGSIDFDRLARQDGDAAPRPFSHRTANFQPTQMPCHITHTSVETHRLVRDNIGLSPLYAGVIKGVGARYCPSLEDKVMRFPDKASHQVTIEPEGRGREEVYAKGLGNCLPLELQERLVRSVPGLERAEIVRPAYAIEYDFARPTALLPTLEAKAVGGLFLAGQINGTSGYEEAGAQGLWAGVNAACRVQGRPPFVPDRSQAYMAVMVDDLVTRGTEEPYRMFTSRAEYRLSLREDNADLRLTPLARELGLVTEAEARRVGEKARLTREGRRLLAEVRIAPGPELARDLAALGSPPPAGRVTAAELLKRTGVTMDVLARAEPSLAGLAAGEAAVQLEIAVKYEGYLRRQEEAVERFRAMERAALPPDIDYGAVPGLSHEVRQKLAAVRPATLGQAARISGVTPAAVSILMVWLRGGAGRGGKSPGEPRPD